MYKRIIYLLIISLICSPFTGCNKTASNDGLATHDELNTLVWNLSYANIASWDPHFNNSSISTDINHQLFEGLTVLDEKGYELGVAESFTLSPIISPNAI